MTTVPNYYIQVSGTSDYAGNQLANTYTGDTTCQIALGSSYYLAMMVAQSREASPTQVDWVLLPSTTYVTADSLSIGTTNSDAIFTFPFTAAIGSSFFAWTGLSNDWTTGNTCNNWTYNGTGNATPTYTGDTGNSSSTTDEAISQGSTDAACSMYNGFYCVEQATSSTPVNSTGCTCSTTANTSCNNFCISNDQGTMSSQTCTTTGGAEGYCYCTGGIGHGVSPGSMCATTS